MIFNNIVSCCYSTLEITLLNLYSRFLNKYVKGHVMGPRLAKALFSVVIHRWNERRPNSRVISNNANESFELCGSSSQATQPCLQNFLGKWTSQRSVAFNHYLVPKVYTLRMILSKYRVFNLEEMISKKFPPSLLLPECQPRSKVKNFKNFNYESVHDDLTSKDNHLHHAISDQICDLMEKSPDWVKKHHSENGFNSSNENNSRILRCNALNCIISISDYIGLSVIIFTEYLDLPILPIFPKDCLNPAIWLFITHQDGAFSSVK